MFFPHWQYFEALDDELHSLSRVIEFDEANYTTFSVQLTRLYLSVGSEIDVVAKLICDKLGSKPKPPNIDGYRSVIGKTYQNFSSLKIVLPSHELEFQPWSAWAVGENPKWWKSYNKVKHDRSNFFRDANLGNLLESSAGLFVLLVYLHQPQLYSDDPPINPGFKTMRIDPKYAGVMKFGFSYSLPDFGKSGPRGLKPPKVS